MLFIFLEKDGQCQEALGMESHSITDGQISASSQYSAYHAAFQGRLHSQYLWKAGAWSTRTDNLDQWLQVDLGSQYPPVVTRVATQGRNGYDQWVKTYKLQYSNDTASFHYYKEPGKNEHKVKIIYRQVFI